MFVSFFGVAIFLSQQHAWNRGQWKGLLCETWSVSHLWNGHIRHVDEVGNSSNLLELTPQRSMMVHASHWEKT
jgi:hypothetical protein